MVCVVFVYVHRVRTVRPISPPTPRVPSLDRSIDRAGVTDGSARACVRASGTRGRGGGTHARATLASDGSLSSANEPTRTHARTHARTPDAHPFFGFFRIGHRR